MDATRAIVRSKRRESKLQSKQQQLRIDHPLVSYNEYDQPFCKACNIPLKSEALWDAHRRSMKHHENEQKFKSAPAGVSPGNNATQSKPQKAKSSNLPADFLEKQGMKRMRNDTDLEGPSHLMGVALESRGANIGISSSTLKQMETSYPMEEDAKADGLPDTRGSSDFESSNRLHQAADETGRTGAIKPLKGTLPATFFDDGLEGDILPAAESAKMPVDRAKGKQALPEGFFDREGTSDSLCFNQSSQPSKEASGANAKESKGALPEGFFDNKDADLRARGIQPVKVDINDAYKEFEKDIQEDLQGVDERLEEEEIDAAIEREEFMTLEQREYREKVDMVKKKILETKASRSARANLRPPPLTKESSDGSSSDDDGDDDDDVNFAVDWRAQHL